MPVRFFALLAVLFSPMFAHAQTDLTPREALQVLRAVNTAQAQVKATRGAFAPLPQLGQQDARLGGQMKDITDTRASLAGYTLTLTLSPDGKTYLAAVAPTQACGRSYFTSEAGVIFEGRALGCPAQ